MSSRRLIAILAAMLILATACGGSGDSASSDGRASGEPAAGSGLPDLDVIDVATGETVSLPSLAPSDRPTLLWFWAPH